MNPAKARGDGDKLRITNVELRILEGEALGL